MSHRKPSEELFTAARSHEKRCGKPYYVVWVAVETRYTVTDRMPLFGEWYTSDGIRHG